MSAQQDTAKQESKLSKATYTWLVKNYNHKLLHPDDKRTFNRAGNCVQFLTRHSPENKKLAAAAMNYYYKNKNAIKTKLARTKNSPKLKKLIAKYPKLNIERAYKFAVINEKLSLTQDDIDFFEKMLIIAIKKA